MGKSPSSRMKQTSSNKPESLLDNQNRHQINEYTPSDEDFMNDEGWINMDIVKGRARKVCFILMITSSFGYLFDEFFFYNDINTDTNFLSIIKWCISNNSFLM